MLLITIIIFIHVCILWLVFIQFPKLQQFGIRWHTVCPYCQMTFSDLIPRVLSIENLPLRHASSLSVVL